MSRLLICGVVFALAGSAAAHDPAIEWRTLHSPVVRVHYPDGRYRVAVSVARAASIALEELTTRLAWQPQLPIDIVLNDASDSANGSAQVVPYGLVHLNVAPPDEVSQLMNYDDWVFELVAHELAHIVHLDTVLGLPAALNVLLGRSFFPNGAQPRWFIEGLATYFESTLGGAGRVGSSYFDMMLRAAVLADEIPSLDEVSGAPRHWPQGTTPYLWGSYFVDYLARQGGEDALRAVSHDYAGRIVPYAINLSARRVFGEGYPELYDAFVAELRAHVAERRNTVLREGHKEGERLTDRGQEVGPARFAADGTLYFIESSVSGPAALRALGPDGGERKVARVYGGASLALVPGGELAVLSQVEMVGPYRAYGDLFTVELRDGATRRLTEGARVQGVDVAADGDTLVVAQLDGLHSVLRVTSLRAPGQVTTLVDLGPDTQVWSPRFSPDGQQVVFAGFSSGWRDLFVVDRATSKVRRLTSDAALDGSPVFAADGQHVLFHSDRDGVFDIYALSLASPEVVRRLTHVLGGAFRPELGADGTLVYQSYGVRGFDLAALSIGPLAGQDLAPSPRAAAAPLAHYRADVHPTRDYSALPSLRPRAWLPLVSLGPDSVRLGAFTTGQDAVGLHAYALAVDYDARQEFWSFDVLYGNQQFHPGATLRLSRRLGFASFPYVRNGFAQSVPETVWSGELSAFWPLWQRRTASLGLQTSYQLEVRHNREPLRLHPLDDAPSYPDEGRFASGRVGLRFSNVEAFIDSISPERGLSAGVSFRLEDPYLGSEYSAVVGSADLSLYLENPWVERHVLALSGTAGYGDSTYKRRSLFAIGGLVMRDVLLDLLSLRIGTPQSLRGFPIDALRGDAMAAGTAEYRFPLWDVDRGIAALPLFLRSLHAAAFIDAAVLGDTPRDLLSTPHASVGGELRLGLLVGYYLPMTLRIGFGHGLGSDKVSAVFLALGNTF